MIKESKCSYNGNPCLRWLVCQILDVLKEVYDLPKGYVGLVICNLLELAESRQTV